MYHFIVRRVVQQGFRQLSRADFEAVLKNFAQDVTFSFGGQHSLSGSWCGVPAVRLWFGRLHHFFPELQLEPNRILVSGWPWNTLVVTFFSVRAVLSDGQAYENDGIQVLRLRWGQVFEDHLVEDTVRLAQALTVQAGEEKVGGAPVPNMKFGN